MAVICKPLRHRTYSEVEVDGIRLVKGDRRGRESSFTINKTTSKDIHMKTNIITRILCTALLTFGLITSALAGPGPHEVYTPVKTMPEAQKIPVGSRIALSCDNGGPVTIVTVEAGRDYLKGFTCPVSKKLYRFSPGGGGHTADQFIYKTDDGLTAHLLTLGKI